MLVLKLLLYLIYKIVFNKNNNKIKFPLSKKQQQKVKQAADTVEKHKNIIRKLSLLL